MEMWVVIFRAHNQVQVHACSSERKAWEIAGAVAMNLIRHGYLNHRDGHACRMEIDAVLKAGERLKPPKVDWEHVVKLYVSFTPGHYIGVQRTIVDAL